MRVSTAIPAALFVALLPSSAGGQAALGRIAYAAVEEQQGTRLYSVNADGSGRRVISRFRCCRRTTSEDSPSWSPDGQRLAFVRNTWRRPGPTLYTELYRSNADGSDVRLLTRSAEMGADYDPDWHPHGGSIVFVRERPAKTDEGGTSASLHLVPAAGGAVRRLTRGEFLDQDPDWSRDGSALAFVRYPPNEFGLVPQQGRLMLTDQTGSARPFPRRLYGTAPAWSPDGRRIAFVSYRDRNGVRCDRDHCFPFGEVYVVNTDGSNLRRLTRSRLDESDPSWSLDGRWIAYAAGDTRFVVRQFERVYRIPVQGGRPRLIARGRFNAHHPAWSPRR